MTSKREKRSALNGLITRVVGARLVSRVVNRATRARLRVLAFHGISDPRRFGVQLDYIASRFTPVSGSQVADALDGGAALPRGSVWVTFDDGRRDVLEHGLPLLRARGIPATLFVCGAWVDTKEPFWWDIVHQSVARGLIRPDDVGVDAASRIYRTVKRWPDHRRRSLLADLTRKLQEAAVHLHYDHLTRAELASWIEAGNDVGNHSWDHPCFDLCDEREQLAQVERSHARLTGLLGHAPSLFAWPSGKATDVGRRALQRLGYRAVLGFEHQLCDADVDRFAIPRLRLDSDDDLPRVRAVLSGAHSALFAVATKVRELRA
jgi:peptidoglycan/xylan/chitin deacetylase (PgdA/CDA1 family)